MGRLCPIALQVRRPSADPSRLANEFDPRLPQGLRFLLRGAGTRQTRSNMATLEAFLPSAAVWDRRRPM